MGALALGVSSFSELSAVCRMDAKYSATQGKRILFLKGRLGKGFRHLVFMVIAP
jgi:hypothetical protein